MRKLKRPTKWLLGILAMILVSFSVLLFTPEPRDNYTLADAPYYLHHDVGQETLKSCWVTDSGLTVNQVKLIYPKLFARLTAAPFNWPDSMVMKMNVFPAAWNDAVLWGQGGGQPITGRITSNNGIHAPPGVYAVNYPCILDGGKYIGEGTGFAGTVGGARSMNTNLVLNRAGWLGSYGGQPFDVMNLMQTTTWGILSGSTAYTESGYLDGFRLTGDNGSWWDASYISNGLGMWDMGETWKVGRIFAETFNGYGIMNVRGTPATYGEISCFQNALGGIGLIGTELNTININTISGDDNPGLIVMRAGYGRGGGGTVNVNLEKSESGKRTPNKGQVMLWQRDPCYGDINISIGQGDMNGLFLDAQFVMNTNTSSAGQMLHAQFRAWNYRTLVHDVTNQVRWAAQSYRPECITYAYRNGNSTLFDCAAGTQLTPTAVNASDRLGLVVNNGVFDYANGLPVYDITGGGSPPPPPPTCVWVPGAWGPCGPCVNYECVITRTVQSSVLGCVPAGTPPATTDTISCGTPPPPPTAAYVLTPANNSSVSTSMDIPNTLTRRIVLYNVTFTDPLPPTGGFNYQRLACEVVTSGSPTGIRIKPTSATNKSTGSFISPTGQTGTSSSGGPIVLGQFYPQLTITFASPINIDRLFAIPGTGSAIRMTCSRLELYTN